MEEMLALANERGLQDWELQPARETTMDDIEMEGDCSRGRVRRTHAHASDSLRPAAHYPAQKRS